MAKFNSKKVVSPKGVAKWARLDKADTKFLKEGMYSVQLIVSDMAAKPFIDMVVAYQKEQAKENKAKKLAKLGYDNEVDDQGNETRNIVFKFVAKNRLTKDGRLWDRKPTVFDIHGNKIEARVGGGSIIKVAAELVPNLVKGEQYVSFHLSAVQVHELVEFGSGTATSFGFEVEEDNATSEDVGTAQEDEDLF